VGQAPIRVGGVEVGVVCEGFAPIALTEELPGEDVDWAAERAANPWAFHDAEHWAWHVHAFSLATDAGIVMVDSGVGDFPPYLPWAEHTPREESLAAAGIDARDVVAVILTHLHADHAGGTVVDGVPTFPNAVHHAHPADWSFFAQPGEIDGYTARGPMKEIERLRLLDLTENDHEVAPGVRVVHAPGHTPGHRVVVLEAGDETMVLTGDLLHQPVQVVRAASASSHDEDPDEACRSRVAILSSARDGRWLVAAGHFARPFGRVTDQGWNGHPSVETKEG
jgi:glyoxylase-like metal-dependent hydrolase (beta-lactamase superfamily II)